MLVKNLTTEYLHLNRYASSCRILFLFQSWVKQIEHKKEQYKRTFYTIALIIWPALMPKLIDLTILLVRSRRGNGMEWMNWFTIDWIKDHNIYTCPKGPKGVCSRRDMPLREWPLHVTITTWWHPNDVINLIKLQKLITNLFLHNITIPHPTMWTGWMLIINITISFNIYKYTKN